MTELSVPAGPPPDEAGWRPSDVAGGLRALRRAAGDPSFTEIARRIGQLRAARGVPASECRPGRVTVYDCFRDDRRRLDSGLVADIARALGADETEAARWARACLAAQGRADAATVVSVRAALPAAVPEFVGRTAQLERLAQLVTREGVRAAVVEGMAGAGKTQLAVRAAQRALGDGVVDQVVVADLRGFHPDQPPADPDAVLGALLRGLGVPGRQVPVDRDGLIAAYRQRLGQSRVLVLLDDAAGPDQVQPLLPPVGGSVALVTSRRSLAGLDEVERTTLEEFRPDEAVELLRRVAGHRLVDDEPAVAAEITTLLGYSPLAVGLTASRIAARAGWSLGDHLEVLAKRRRGLRLDDAVRTSFDLSYAALSEPARTTLRMLAVHPCADLDDAAVAALTGTGQAAATAALAELAGYHLVTERRPGRFFLHALVHTYALDRSDEEDRGRDRDGALDRLATHLTAWLWAAAVAVRPQMAQRYRWEQQHAGYGPRQLTSDAALAWFDVETENVLALAGRRMSRIRPTLTMEVSEGIAVILNQAGRNHDARVLHAQALETAQLLDDRRGIALAQLDVGRALVRVNEWDQAAQQLGRAEAALARLGDDTGRCAALNALAIMDTHLGRPARSVERLLEVLAVVRRDDELTGLTVVLDNLAICYRRLGRLAEAVECHRESLDVAVRLGDRYMQASTWANLSETLLCRGDTGGALESAERGLAIGRELSAQPVIGYSTANVANARSALGDPSGALPHHEEALRISREVGDRHLEASVLNDTARTHHRLEDVDQAEQHLAAALEVAIAIGDRFEQGRALECRGTLRSAHGDREAATTDWRGALEIFDALGCHEADELRARLATAPAGG